LASPAQAVDKVVIIPLDADSVVQAETSADQSELFLESDLQTIKSVTVQASGPGIILADASGTIIVTSDRTARFSVSCAIVKDSPTPASRLNLLAAGSRTDQVPMGITHGFKITSAGPVNIYFICDLISGAYTKISHSSLSAVFFPD